MIVMGNMIQFVVVIPVPDKSSAVLESYFMQKYLLKFGMCILLSYIMVSLLNDPSSPCVAL